MVATFDRPQGARRRGPRTILVMSAHDAACLYGPRGSATCDAMIGIKSPGYRFPGISRRRVRRLIRLTFFDALAADPESMRRDDADAVVGFVRTLPASSKLAIHCEGGVSRSAGIAAAIMDGFWGDGAGDACWTHPRLNPNEHCWRLVRDAEGLKTTDVSVRDHVRLDMETMD